MATTTPVTVLTGFLGSGKPHCSTKSSTTEDPGKSQSLSTVFQKTTSTQPSSHPKATSPAAKTASWN